MANDYIPKPDSIFKDWLTNFVKVAQGNLVTLGLTTTDISSLDADREKFGDTITNAESMSAQAKAATEKKNLYRKATESKARALVKRIQAKVDVPADLKKQLQITVPGQSAPIPVKPYNPTELVAKVIGSGTYELSWNRNGNSGAILFIIEGLFGNETAYRQVFVTTKTNYIHSNNIPGQKIIYRIRAQHGEILSDPSNDAIING